MEKSNQVKWPEILSLAALNVALVISWIAYHEYQPILLENFSFTDLSSFLVISKAIILVIIPPMAGLTADYLLRKNGKFFVIFTVGIGATAMIFMVVASIIGAGPANDLKVFLPYMILLWLISMNLFVSPAYSMIEAFAPAKKLPVVVGFLFLVTELIYALEPVVVSLVRFFGDTLTFIVGGVLISVSGFFFHKICSANVMSFRKDNANATKKKTSVSAYVAIIGVGFFLGAGKAVLVEYFPGFIAINFPNHEQLAAYFSLGLLAFSAIFAFLISNKVSQMDIKKVIVMSFLLFVVGALGILFSPSLYFTLFAGVVVAAGFGLINLVGIPFAIANLSARHITYGIGIFIGASELLTGIFEIVLN
ncbi:hypothetical protein N6H18_06030 [Reichenbachiella agarivorans]|uniref:Major Facilitator Superfamily protein n=1 Tax=Reichenbachiella agarivorans TaxID=2979464 RepID=A0ABY6CZ49_9BACT|nr:hypothetical protein [Reichenbachiella agarivorans]UXP33510.1 hypothetical protein N6H18_06030 [Reichenbachiella agarivorans]